MIDDLNSELLTWERRCSHIHDYFSIMESHGIHQKTGMIIDVARLDSQFKMFKQSLTGCKEMFNENKKQIERKKDWRKLHRMMTTKNVIVTKDE